jgi:hypothetical protein
VVVFSITSRAAAQGSPPEESTNAAADASFIEGVKLIKADRCEEAIPKFRESEQLELASGTLLNLAYCQARLGLVASAWLTYRRAIPLAQKLDKPQHEAIAREQADKLAPELPTLSFRLAGDAGRSLVIELDGQPLPPETVSAPVPVDPGVHRVSAKLENGRTWETSISLVRSQQVAIEVPAAEAASSPGAAPTLAAPASSSANTSGAPARLLTSGTSGTVVNEPTGTRSVWALGLAIAGAGAMVTGGALFVSARLKYDAAHEHCSADNECTSHWYDEEKDAIRRAKISAAFLGTGAIAVGVGAVLYLTDSGKPRPRANIVASVSGPRDWVAAFQGAW